MEWFKSSRCGGSFSCVEVARLPDGGTAVRDSKDQGNGPVLGFTPDEWTAFVGGVKAGEFDHLAGQAGQ